MKKAKINGALLIMAVAAFPMAVLAMDLGSTPKYRMAAVQAELDLKTYKEASLKATMEQEQIAALEVRIKEAQDDKIKAESEGNPIGVLNAEAIIESTTAELKNVKTSSIESQLQVDLASYYSDYKEERIQQQENVLYFNNYRTCCDLKIIDVQIEYQQAVVSELEEKLNIEKEKRLKGYTTQIAVNDISAQLQSARVQSDSLIEQRKFLMESLNTGGGDDKEFENKKELKALRTDYQAAFLNRSTQKTYYDNQVQSYMIYLERMNGSEENLDQISLQLELVQLQSLDYETQLGLYVKQMIMAYNSLRNSSLAKDGEIKVQNEKIAALQELVHFGKVQNVNVTEAKTNLKKLEYERQQLISQGSIAYYILENQIEGQTL